MKSILLKILSPAVISQLKKALAWLDNKLLPWCAQNSFLSSVYYCLFSTQFRREHQAVLQGRLAYAQSLQKIQTSSVLLRRNTHRLEKGLIMQPRRDVFAESYISETVSCFEKCLASQSMCADELKWAEDVLSSYFAVVIDTEITAKAKKQFQQLALSRVLVKKNYVPYQHHQRTQSNVSAQQLALLFQQRRSVRWYQQKPVNNDVIKQAITMAAQAPSACNRQPFKFYTVTDMILAADIANIAMGTVGFADNIPALIVVVGDLSAYPSERDRHVIYIDGGLATMQLMLAFETLGMSTCPINWPDIDKYERLMTKKLKLNSYQRPIMLLAVGHALAEGGIAFSQKKSADLLCVEVPKC